ncbi:MULTISPECIES: efflux RND transporter periplasmic adaptor subunit [unclassified Moraxella]|uniref:efflux RND transporter periplasmic adaptor subunit n=1 Tax=unclassified Moraxella TaxID=2685852 RepID=UPI00359EA6A8
MKLSVRAVMIAAVFSSMALVTACNKSDQAKQASAQQQMPPVVVDVQTINLTSIPMTKTFSGRVAAVETSEVRPQVTGIIDEILFHEGGFVRAGQPLYRINTDNYASAINSGKASVASAEAAAQNARAVHAQAQANLTAQQAMLTQAQADLARLKDLVEVDAVSKQVYDQAITAVRTAEANVGAAQATVAQARASIGSADAAINSAKASLNASELDYSRTIVRAPISGKIGISAVTNGALVAANQANALATIARTDYVYVDISQSSSEMLRLRQQIAEGKASYGGPEVQIVLEDGEAYPLMGQLILADARVDESTGSVTIRAVFANPDGVLIPGMYVNAKLMQSIVNNAVALPQSAITRTPKGETQVYVVNQDKKIEARIVKTAGTFQGQWVITEGLVDGDQVVMVGAAKVKPDQLVETRPYTSSQPKQAGVSGMAGQNTVMAPQADNSNSKPNVQNAQRQNEDAKEASVAQ